MSVSITSAWRDEPDYVVGYYEEIAGKPPVQRNLTSTPLLENLNGYNGHILNHVEGIRQHHYNPIRYHFDRISVPNDMSFQHSMTNDLSVMLTSTYSLFFNYSHMINISQLKSND